MKAMGVAALWLVIGVAHAGADYHTALDAWAQVLHEHVDEQGRTDFRALAMQGGELGRFVDAVGSDGPKSRPAAFDTLQEQLAYHINAYNALAMHGVIDEGIPRDFDGFFKRAGFFRFRAVRVDGEKTNLYDYENDVIRPLGDPRVHFALNCMVRDCPRLPREPFRAQTLDAELDAAAREFLNSEKHVRTEPSRKTVWLSAIIDFYTEDFAPEERDAGIIDYLNRYRTDPVPRDWRVRYLDYDWTVNQAP